MVKTQRVCDICGKEITDHGHTIKIYPDYSRDYFRVDMTDEICRYCAKDIRAYICGKKQPVNLKEE